MKRMTIAITLLLFGLALGMPARAQETGEMVTRGRSVFFAQGCYGCHTLGAAGTPIAPDLSRIGAKYSRSWLEGWLRDPAAQRPTAHMPKLELSDNEVKALAAFLASLTGP